MWVGKDAAPMAVKAERELDLGFLSRKERRSVLKVLERDKRLRMIEAERMGRLFPGGRAEEGETSISPLRTQSVWSISASLSCPEENPQPLKASFEPSTQANTGSYAGRVEDMSNQVRKPNLRSRISSLLSIKFLQRSNRDTSSRYREANKSSREMHINIVDMNISNSDIDTDSSRDSHHISHGNRDMGSSSKHERIRNGITDTSRSKDMNVSIGNEDTNRSSDVHIGRDNRDPTRSSDVHIRRDNRDTTRGSDVHIRRDNRDTSRSSDWHISRDNRDTSISSNHTDISNTDASNSSSRGALEINDHEVSHEKQPAITRQKETDQKTGQTDKHAESSFQRTPLNARTPTDQPQRVQYDRKFSHLSKSNYSDSSHASFLPKTGASPSEIWKGQQRRESEQQSTNGTGEAKDQLQSKAFAFSNTKLRDKGRFMSDTWIPGSSEEKHPFPSGTDTNKESLNFTKDAQSDKNKDSCEPNLSIPSCNNHQSHLPLRYENENKRKATSHPIGGTEKNQVTSGISLIKVSVSTRRDNGEGPVAGVSMFSTPKSPKEDNTNKLLTEKNSFGVSTKQVTYAASQPPKTTEARVERANGFTRETSLSTDPVRSPRASSRMPVWRSHPSYRHSLDQAYSPSPSSQDPSRSLQHAKHRLNSYPAQFDSCAPLKVGYHTTGNSLVKAKSCEKLLQKAARVDSPSNFFPPASNLISMSSSERINILAKQHASALKPGGDSCELKGSQVPYNQTWRRCNSTYDINSSQYSEIPLNFSGAVSSRLTQNHRSLTVSNLTLPQHRLSKDRYPHQPKLSVFVQRPHSTIRSHDNLSEESIYKDNSLNTINTNTAPVPNNKKRDYPSNMTVSQVYINGGSHVDFTDSQHQLSSQNNKVKEDKRWSSVSELGNPEGYYVKQRQCFRKDRMFTQNPTHTKSREFLLASIGSQISLDFSCGDTDDDIFSTSPGQCRQEGPPNYLSAYGKALKPHHRSSSNVYQTSGDQTAMNFRGNFGLTQGRSVSVSNVSTNRTACPRQMSAGSRNFEDFEDAISPKPRTISCTSEQAVSSGPVERFPTTSLFWRGGSLTSSSGSLLSSSQVCLDNPFPSRNYHLTYVESEDGDSDTASEGEYYLYGQGDDLESPL